MTIADLLTYATAIFFASIIPGPSMGVAFSHGIRFGIWKSNSTALGNVVASLCQAITSFIVTLAFLTTFKGVFAVIQAIGGVYLGYLGYRLLGAKLSFSTERKDELKKLLLLERFKQGFFIAILNPKAIFFFTALFPQFAKKTEVGVPGLLFLFAPIGLIAYICFMMYAFMGNEISHFLEGTVVGQNLNKIIGSFFIFIGIGSLVLTLFEVSNI